MNTTMHFIDGTNVYIYALASDLTRGHIPSKSEFAELICTTWLITWRTYAARWLTFRAIGVVSLRCHGDRICIRFVCTARTVVPVILREIALSPLRHRNRIPAPNAPSLWNVPVSIFCMRTDWVRNSARTCVRYINDWNVDAKYEHKRGKGKWRKGL